MFVQANGARRLRPPDLWLPVETSLVEWARPYDWDFRDLADGGVAKPFAPSSFNGEKPNTSIVSDGLLAAADGFPDQGIISEALHGICDDSRVERGSLFCAPHVGALRFINESLARVRAGLDNGWAREFNQLPCWPIRCDPFGCVDESEKAGKPKFRLTNDHSWPKPGMLWDPVSEKFVDSINGSMDRTDWPTIEMVRVRQVAEAAGILRSSGMPVKGCVIDGVAFCVKRGRGAMSADVTICECVADGRCYRDAPVRSRSEERQ